MTFFSKKKKKKKIMPRQRVDSIVPETIKIGKDLIQLRINPYICERHKALFFSQYLYKISQLKKELS